MKSSLLSPWRKKLYKIITFSIWSPSDKTQCVPVGIQQVLLILRNSTKESQNGDPSPLEGPGLSPEEYWHHAERRTLPRAVLTKGEVVNLVTGLFFPLESKGWALSTRAEQCYSKMPRPMTFSLLGK